MKSFLKLSLIAVLLSLPTQVFAGHHDPALTDEASSALFSFIDLRQRETYVQVTNIDTDSQTLHVQIFNVDQNCNENNFFDVFTPNDTHIYDMRNILTNDGNPSGVVLPENAYGFVVISVIDSDGELDDNLDFLIGNFRILDDAGYEYRTNSAGESDSNQPVNEYNFNFSNKNGISHSDIVFIAVEEDSSAGEWVAGPTEAFWEVDVDIFDINENPLSCRDVIFSCVDADNPLLEELISGELTTEGSSSSVAAFEYGINEVIPHSRDGELLCPGNVTPEGWVNLTTESNFGDAKGYFVGLNNGNGRGSMDSIWRPTDFITN